LAQTFGSLAAVRGLDRAGCMVIPGIKEAMAEAMVEGLQAKHAVIEDLLAEVRVPDQEIPPASAGHLPLAGQSFVFTGTLLTLDRKEAEAQVRRLGGETPPGVSASLTYLVLGQGRGAPSTKQRKAEKLQQEGAAIAILDEQGFLDLLEPYLPRPE
jgi:DNA ligase (NAD+)